MKRMIGIFALTLGIGTLFNACDNGRKTSAGSDNKEATMRANGAEPVDSFPWDFPKDFTLRDVEVGQTVLSPAAFYGGALQRGESLSETLLPIYSNKVKAVGKYTLTVEGMHGDIDVPQALVVPFPKDVKAQNGDVLLTWWQSGQGLQRAIVVDDTKQLTPKVCYLDLDYRTDGRGFANSHANEELKPNSFKVLKNGEWTSGASVAVEDNGLWKSAIILNMQGDKLLLTDAGNHITVAEKSKCKLLPIELNYNEGDSVFAKIGHTFQPDCKVVKVDRRVGRIRVEKNAQTYVVSMLDVTKKLDELPKK